MATIYKASGVLIQKHPRKEKFRKSELEEVLKGTPEYISMPGGMVMVVNDDQSGPLNEKASRLYPRRKIYGDVLLCERRELR